MSMRLTSAQLIDIAGKVDQIDELGVDVKLIEVHDHDVYLQKDNGKHVIVGLSNKKQNPGGATR